MTQIINGFVTIDKYINNQPNQTSVIGELSTWSTTYSRQKEEYNDTNIPGYSLVVFKSINDISNQSMVVDNTQVNQILSIVSGSIDYTIDKIQPYNVTNFIDTLLADFGNRVSNIEIGSFVNNGEIALPEWMSWTSKENNNTFVKIWLSDNAFADQYEYNDILVIPPIANLDNLFGIYSHALTTIQDRTSLELSTLIETAKSSNPETYIRFLSFDYINPTNPAVNNSTTWIVLVYGKSGDNIDSIKDAIVEYALNNSSHNRTEWTAIFPNIFKRTEFIIIPRWDKVAIPNLTSLTALYQSIVDPSETIDHAKSLIDYYSDSFISNNISIVPITYKTISLVVINGESNIVGSKRLMDIIPDYIPVSTSSSDFNRMRIRTRELLVLIERAVIVAETITRYSNIGTDMRKIYRANKLYVSFLYNNINYLVYARTNLPS